MRNKTTFFMVLHLLILMSHEGCVVLSVHPLYKTDDVTYTSDLLGTWISSKTEQDSEEARLIFTNNDDEENVYNFTINSTRESGERVTGKFNARLVKLDDLLFIDMVVDMTPDSIIAMNYLFILYPHCFAQITINDDVLHMGFVNIKWFDPSMNMDISSPQSKGKPSIPPQKDISFEVTDWGQILLTASTEELQKFFIKNAHNEELFEFYEYHRFKNSQ